MALKSRRTQNRTRQQNKKRKTLRKNTRKNFKKKDKVGGGCLLGISSTDTPSPQRFRNLAKKSATNLVKEGWEHNIYI